jgi:hypothetical protein
LHFDVMHWPSFWLQLVQAESGVHFWVQAVSPQSHACVQAMNEPHGPPKAPVL